jgi:D-sedoheptulose 7-phosphate isomerase
LNSLPYEHVADVVGIFCSARDQGKSIFFLGNGGSAAIASHFANDLAIGTRLTEKPFKAISLTDNNAILTSLGNDEGYENIFRKQLEVYLEPGDVVVVISSSGNSPNLLEAVRFAKGRGNQTIAFIGFDGGQLKGTATCAVHVKSALGDYGPCEDIHTVLNHLIASFLYRKMLPTNQAEVEAQPNSRFGNVASL